MSTLDVVAYAGEKHGGVKPANFLDIGGGASAQVMADGLEIILSDPDVRSVFVNVFGGITPATPSPTASCRPWRCWATRRPSRSSSGWTATTSRRATASWRRPPPPVTVVDTMDGAADKAAELGERARRTPWRSSSTREQQGHRPGHHRLRGHQAHPADGRVRHQRRRRRQPAQGRVDVDGIPVFATVAEAMEETGADVSVVFVPPAFAKRPWSRRSTPDRAARRRHHRGHPGAGLRLVLGLRPGQGHPDHRPELPRPDQPGQVQRRHHPGHDHQARAGSGWSARAAR